MIIFWPDEMGHAVQWQTWPTFWWHHEQPNNSFSFHSQSCWPEVGGQLVTFKSFLECHSWHCSVLLSTHDSRDTTTTSGNKPSHLMTKPTKWHVCPAKTQISLGICGCPGWSESSLDAYAILLVLSWGGSTQKQPTYIIQLLFMIIP